MARDSSMPTRIWKRCFIILIYATCEAAGWVTLNGLPNTVSVPENSPAHTMIGNFSVSLSSPSTAVAPGYPKIINSNPLTEAFAIFFHGLLYTVETTGNPILDYESSPKRFDLQIFVIANNGQSDLQTLTIQLLDVNEPPVFLDNMAIQDVVVYITEETRPGAVYNIQASDPESGTNNLTYSLATNSTSAFRVSIRGVVTSSKRFDYETEPHRYILTVTVTDPGGLSVSGTLVINIININDCPPEFTMTTTSFVIPEEQAPGTFVANVTAFDPDDDGVPGYLHYSIDPPVEYFSINQVTGIILVAMRIDREASHLVLSNVIKMRVVIRDSPTNGHTASEELNFIILDINDNPPVCNPTYRTEIPEIHPNNSIITRIECIDSDVEPPNNIFGYSEGSGFGSNRKFILSSNTTGTIQLIGNLDFELTENNAVENEYTLSVVVRDVAAPYYSTTAYVYISVAPVNEFPPVFQQTTYVFNVSEMLPGRSQAGQVTATDQDLPGIPITYSLLAGGSTLGYSEVFWINPATGAIQLVVRPDYETTPLYTLIVQAVDGGPPPLHTATAAVTVYIMPANDEPPVCKPNSYSMTIPPDLSMGTNIQRFQLTCTDRDSSPRSFRYVIGSGNVNNHFAFSPSAGTNVTSLILATPFDFSSGVDTVQDYNLLIHITDDNLLPGNARTAVLVQTGTIALRIHVYIPVQTTKAPTQPGDIEVMVKSNTFSSTAWYVPFIITLAALLLLGLLGYLISLMAKHIRCPRRSKPDKEPLINKPEKKIKKDIIVEMTKLHTVFDGESVDPVTGKVYEYNSKSGARRWKDTSTVPNSSISSLYPNIPQTAVTNSRAVTASWQTRDDATKNSKVATSSATDKESKSETSDKSSKSVKENKPPSRQKSPSNTLQKTQEAAVRVSPSAPPIILNPQSQAQSFLENDNATET